MRNYDHDYHVECQDTKGIMIEGKKTKGVFRKTFHCFLAIREFLDKIAWENSDGWEEYEEAIKYLDGCKLKIKGAKFTTIFDEANAKRYIPKNLNRKLNKAA